MYNGFKLAVNENFLDEVINEKSIEYVFNPQEEFEKLEEKDKKALYHLVKAAIILDDVFLKQDCSKNIEMKKALQNAADSGDTHALKALKLLKVFNGIEGNDGISKDEIRIFKDLQLACGKNVYPEDATKEEIVAFLKENIEEIPSVLSYDTVVRRDDNGFKGIPYNSEFNKEYKAAARELLHASKETSHEGLKKYLTMQAQALVTNDPEYAFKADLLWASLHDSPLEFTIGRESYADSLTGAIIEDKDLTDIIKTYGMCIKSKDFIGTRVGIVDLKLSQELADYKNHLQKMSELMPLKEQYKQSVDYESGEPVKQTLIDVDLVYLSGDYAALRPGITLAQNLPNDDKLAVKLDCGNRNVFHKQVRRTFDPERRKKMLNSLVDESLHSLYDNEADHLFTIGHELTHSLGPMATLAGADKKVSLGDGYGDIIEENKADLGSLVCLEYFEKIGKYSEDLIKSILVTWAVDQLPISEPKLIQPHRVREVMQLNYFIEKGAILLEEGQKLDICLEKMIPTARQMLTEVIQIQLDGDPAKAARFVDKYRAWNKTLQYISDEKLKLKPKPYKILVTPLADKLLSEK